jgi:hypothetical protein
MTSTSAILTDVSCLYSVPQGKYWNSTLIRSLLLPSKSSPIHHSSTIQSYFFLIGIVGGGVQLGLLSTTANNKPAVQAPGDYDDGEIGGMITGRRN